LEFLGFTLVLNNNEWLVFWTSFNLEWPELDITLDRLILKLSSDKSFGIKHCVKWISGGLILSRITDESFIWGESNV